MSNTQGDSQSNTQGAQSTANDDGMAHLNLSEEQIKEYKEAFSIFDADGDGFISTEELTTVVRSLGYNPTKDEVQKMIKEVDIDGNGQVDFNEFVHLMSKQLNNFYTEEIIKEAFDVMDTDGEGYITYPRLKQLVADMGLELSEEELQEMMAEADVDGEGLVRYEALIELLSFENETLYEAYKRNEIVRKRRAATNQENQDNSGQRAEQPPEDDGDSYDFQAAIEDGQVPDTEAISRQYVRKKYDRFSRQPVQKTKVIKVPGEKVPMSKTRMAYLQRTNKALVDQMTMTDNNNLESESPRRESRRTIEPWLGSIHDTNMEFDRKFKSNPPGKYRNVSSKIMDDKYYTKHDVQKRRDLSRQPQLQLQKPSVVDIDNAARVWDVNRSSPTQLNQKTSKSKRGAKQYKTGGLTYTLNQLNQRNPNKDDLRSLRIGNTAALSTNTQTQQGKQTNLVTTNKDAPKGYLEMINVKTQERMHFALWRTAFVEAIKKIRDKEEKPYKLSNSRLSDSRDSLQLTPHPSVLTPTLPLPLPRNMITPRHAGSYADSYRKIHNFNAQTPQPSSPSPKLKKPFVPEPKPVLVTKKKINALASMYVAPAKQKWPS